MLFYEGTGIPAAPQTRPAFPLPPGSVHLVYLLRAVVRVRVYP